MTMRDMEAPPASLMAEGAAALRSPVVAVATGDESATLMCVKCGHEFIRTIPFTDESEEIDNAELARTLFYHMCALGRRAEHKERYRDRHT